jgi:hypothetical protein
MLSGIYSKRNEAMNREYISFLRSFAVFFFLVLLAGILWNTFLPAGWKSYYHWELLALFSMVTLAAHFYLLYKIAGKPQAFIRTYMGLTMTRLLLYLIIVFLFIYFNRARAVNFTVTFMVYYIIFTAFEVRSLLSLNKKIK